MKITEKNLTVTNAILDEIHGISTESFFVQWVPIRYLIMYISLLWQKVSYHIEFMRYITNMQKIRKSIIHFFKIIHTTYRMDINLTGKFHTSNHVRKLSIPAMVPCKYREFLLPEKDSRNPLLHFRRRSNARLLSPEKSSQVSAVATRCVTCTPERASCCDMHVASHVYIPIYVEAASALSRGGFLPCS